MEFHEINRITDELMQQSGLIHNSFVLFNGQINYRTLYQCGLLLTDLLQKKHKDDCVYESIDGDKLGTNELELAHKYLGDKIETIKNELTDSEQDLLIKLKYLFKMIDQYRGLNTVDINDVLWGIAISLAKILNNNDVQEKLMENRPFNQVVDFEKIWMEGISVLTYNNSNNFGPDYRMFARNLSYGNETRGDFKTLCRGIDLIGNTNVHAVNCPFALQGAMITSIKSFDDSNEKERILQNLGKIGEADISVIQNNKNIGIIVPEEPIIRTAYNQITPGTKNLTVQEVNKISGASVYKGMNFGKRVIMMGKNYDDSVDDDIIHFEGHNVRKNETDKDPFYVDQPRTLENKKFCDAVDNYKKGAEPARIHVFHCLAQNNWEYKGIYTLSDYEYIKVHGRNVYKFEFRKCNS